MEWIDVNDKLPGKDLYEDNYILILVNNVVEKALLVKGGIMYLPDNYFVFHLQEQIWTSDLRFAKPTHWMPLPKPPKEKSNGS